MTISQQNTTEKFERALQIVADLEAPFTSEMIYGLSDLSEERQKTFYDVWITLPTQRRHNLISRLVETAETNFDLDFAPIIHIALYDPEPDVRRAGIEGVLEDSPLSIIERLMWLAVEDPFSAVRATAASNLGQFVLRGELGKLPGWFNTRLQDTVLNLHTRPHEELEVRRRALEALSNCGREGVIELIRQAYYADELPMRASAVFAMGRSYDETWMPQVLQELDSDEPEMRYEAARAAGELEIRRALPRLTELAYEDEREIQEVAVWSIGEIGGKAARNVLTEMASIAEENNDIEFLNLIQDALSAAQLVMDEPDEDLPPLFDFSDYEDDLDDLDSDDDDFDSTGFRVFRREDLADPDDTYYADDDDDDFSDQDVYDLEDVDPFDDGTV